MLLAFQASELPDPTRFILQLGADAEALEPKALRDHMGETLTAMKAKYL